MIGIKEKIAGGVFFVGFLLMVSLLLRISFLQNKVYQTEMAKDSIEAVSSVTIRTIKGDLQVAQHRIIQTEMEKDSLSKALKTATRIRATMSFQIDSLKASVRTVVVRDSGITSMDFPEIHKPPFKVKASVDIVQDIATLDFTAKIDPFSVGLDVGCGTENNGVRPATATLITPKFVTVSVDSIKQSKEVCSPKPASIIQSGMGIAKKTSLFGSGIAVGLAIYHFFGR